MENFDYLFYLKIYPDLKRNNINNQHDAYNHYIKHGKNEGRLCNINDMKINLEKQNNRILEESKYIKKDKTEKKINILIRTSNRPEHFLKCIYSIKQQEYTNYNVIICYDDDNSLSYLRDFESCDKITYFPIFIESKEKYKFNLYCNILMNKVEDGWIIFLDDDDILSHNQVLSIINDNLNNINSMYLWNYLRADKLIYPKDINNIKLGEIDTTSVCFHNTHKNKSLWPSKMCGDYTFYNGLISNGLNTQYIDFILTKTQHDDIIGMFGD